VISVAAWFARRGGLMTLLSAVIAALASTALASRASVAQGCPESAPGAVSSGAPGAQQQLVPGGGVSLTLCRYRGLNDPNLGYVNQLIGSATLTDAQQLQSIEDQFNALPRLRAACSPVQTMTAPRCSRRLTTRPRRTRCRLGRLVAATRQTATSPPACCSTTGSN
jgi:hypothetical protein